MLRDQEVATIKALKQASGSHSPSRAEIVEALGRDPVRHDFCFLSNPYATDLVVSRLKNQFSDKALFEILESYPASASVVGRRIAKFEKCSPDRIAVGNGAIQCIEWVCHGWGIERLLVPTPTFSTYYEMMGTNAVLSANIAMGKGMCVEKILAEADANLCDAILLIHPNNPTGEVLPLDELRRLVDSLGSRKLIIDESFSHFLSDYNSFQIFRNSCESKQVVFIKSMSKDFGVAGIRLGYMTTVDHKLRDFAKSRSTWNLNNVAVLFSQLLENADFVEAYWSARQKYLSVRDAFAIELQNLREIEVMDSQANFFLLKLPDGASEDIVYEMLIDTGVYVRTMEDKIGLSNKFIRVACRRPEENQLLLNALSERLR